MNIIYYTLSGNKYFLNINSNSKIIHLIHKIKYFHNLSDNILIYILHNNIILNQFDNLTNSFYSVIFVDQLYIYKYYINEKIPFKLLLHEFFSLLDIIDFDLLQHIQFFIDLIIFEYRHCHSLTYLIYDIVCQKIIQKHNVSMVQFLDSLNYIFPTNICTFALRNPDLNVIKFLFHIKHYTLTKSLYRSAIEYFSSLIHYNQLFGSLYSYKPINPQIFLYFKQIDSNSDIYLYLYYYAIFYDSLDLIKYFDRIGFRSSNKWDSDICEYASQYKLLHFLKYFYKNNYSFNFNKCIYSFHSKNNYYKSHHFYQTLLFKYNKSFYYKYQKKCLHFLIQKKNNLYH